MTQRDLAKKLGVWPSIIAKVEIVERNLSASEFVEWSEAVGVNPVTLLAEIIGADNRDTSRKS